MFNYIIFDFIPLLLTVRSTDIGKKTAFQYFLSSCFSLQKALTSDFPINNNILEGRVKRTHQTIACRIFSNAYASVGNLFTLENWTLL